MQPTSQPVLKHETNQITSGALSYNFSQLANIKVKQVTVHADATIPDIMSITLKSRHGTDYDTVIRDIAVNWEDVYIDFEGGIILTKADLDSTVDSLQITCANSGNAKISIVITYESYSLAGTLIG